MKIATEGIAFNHNSIYFLLLMHTSIHHTKGRDELNRQILKNVYIYVEQE